MSRLDQVVQLFEEAPDEDYRAELLIEYATRYRAPSPQLHPKPFPPSSKVPGCESEVYIFSDPKNDGTLEFSFAVENPQGVSAKALASILQESLSGAALEEILPISPEFVHRVFGRTLSMGKGQGLMNMVNIVRFMAKDQLAKK